MGPTVTGRPEQMHQIGVCHISRLGVPRSKLANVVLLVR